MPAHKPRTYSVVVARALSIVVIVFNAFVPTAIAASSHGEEQIAASTNISEGLASSISLGTPESQGHYAQEQVPVLSEQLAEEAQQNQQDKPVRFMIWAEPAIYIPGTPISLHWTVINIKAEDLAAAEVVIHASSGLTPADPDPTYTADGLVSIPFGSEKKVSEWNVGEGAKFPIDFTIDLLLNDDLITSEVITIDQARFSIEKSKGGRIAGMNGKVEVEVPATAISESLDFDIRNPAPNTQPGVSLTWQPVEIIAVGKDTKKNVDTFKAPIKIKMKYDKSQISGWDERALTIHYYDQILRDWLPMETTVDTKNKTLTAYSDHLTVFDYKANNWQSQSLPTVDAFKVAEFTGAGTYAINIWTPPGPGGLQPSLSLNYNSQVIDESSAYSQPSWVGMGWSLDTGAIMRNMHGTDSDDSDDIFSISVGGVSGLLLPVSVNGDITTYNTADQSFLKVEYDSYSMEWKAWGTDGTIYEFARKASTSVADTDGCANQDQLDTVWRWSLTSVTDTNENRLSYTYDVEEKSPSCDNEIAVYPDTITYPNAKYVIRFVTEPRNDYQVAWTTVNSKTLYGTKRLKEIRVEHLGATVRRYALSYAPDTETSNIIYPNFKWSHNNAKTLTLVGVQEFANDTNDPALPAITFNYGDNLHVTDVNNGQGGQVHLDYFPWGYLNDTNDSLRALRTVFGDPNSLNPECIYSGGNLALGTAWTWFSGPGPAWTVGCFATGQDLRVGDNLPGYTATARRSIPENLAKPGGSYRIIMNGRSFVGAVEEIQWGFQDWSTGVRNGWEFSNLASPFSYDNFLTMPMNVNPSETYLYLRCSDCLVEKYQFELYAMIHLVASRTVTIQPGGVTSTYTYRYDNPSPNTTDNSAAVASGGTLYAPKLSEFRGNAMSQVVNPEGLTTVNWFYQTDALKGRPYDSLVMHQTPGSFDDFDIIDPTNWLTSGGTHSITVPPNSFDSAVQSFNPAAIWNVSFSHSSASLTSGEMAVAHIRLSGAGAQGVVGLVSSGGQLFDINLEYNTATATNGAILLSPGNFIPDEWYGVMFFLDATNGSRMRIWQLDNPENFGETVIPGVGSGSWTFRDLVAAGTMYLDSYFEGIPYSETVTRYNTAVQYSVAAVNDRIPSPTVFQDLQVVWNTVASVEQRNYNGDAKFVGTKQEFTYDEIPANYGNLLTQKEYSVGDNGAWALYRGTKYEYYPNTARYVVGLPARQVILDCRSGNCDFTNLTGKEAETFYFYDDAEAYTEFPEEGNLTRQRIWLQNTDYSQISYGYDTFGNQTSQTVYTGYATATQSTDPAGPQPTYTCYGTGGLLDGQSCVDDGYHTYARWVMNPLDQITQTSYDFAVGLPNTLTDPNNAVTSSTYDSFGRLKTITAPPDSSPTLQITYYDTRIPFQVDLTQVVNADASIRLSRFYDGAGRQIQKQTVGALVNGAQKNVVVDYQYNNVGRLVKQSTPNPITFNGSPVFVAQNLTQATTTTYDVLGRTLSVTQPNTNVVSYTYGDLSTIVTDPKQNQTTLNLDEWGRTIFVNATEGPDVEYTYDILNQLKTVVRGGKTTVIYYDGAGRKIDMMDPDMGSWQYQYDGVGNLQRQTDARGQRICLYYDELNRLHYKQYHTDDNCPSTPLSPDVTYTYDEGTNGIGRRTSITDVSGTTTWSYDTRGRVIRVSKTITGMPQAFVTDREYNSADLLKTMKYPDNENLSYGYNSDGSLNSVSSSLGDTYLASTQYDEAGRIKQMDYGASILRKTFSYYSWNTADQGGLLNTAITTRMADSSILQSFTYVYDRNANVSTISDTQAGPQTQTFGYDALNRLTSANVSGGTDGLYSETYEYDSATGNLSVKDGVEYTYHPDHPHAVDYLSNGNDYDYDPNGNMIFREVNGQTFDLAYDAENRLVSVISPGAGQLSLPGGNNALQGINFFASYDLPAELSTSVTTEAPSITATASRTPAPTETPTATLTPTSTPTPLVDDEDTVVQDEPGVEMPSEVPSPAPLEATPPELQIMSEPDTLLVPEDSLENVTSGVDDPYTVALLHMNGTDGETTFTDESGKIWTAHGNVQLDTAQQKFGAASLLSDGNGDHIITPHHSDFDISGDFTFDFWVRFNSVSTSQTLLMKGNSTDGWKLYYLPTALKFINRSGGINTIQMTSTFAPVAGQWYHLAFTRNGNSFRMFADGVQLGGTMTNANPIANTTQDLSIGSAFDGTQSINGWMDEVRFSNGIARWTGNFTPPVSEYTAPVTPTPTPTVTSTPTATGPAPFSSAAFVYDGDGKRVKATLNGTETTYFVGNYYEVTDGVITKYYYAGSQRIAMSQDGALSFILSDHLGSTNLVTDAAGNIISELRYKAWGEIRYASSTTPTEYTYTGQYSQIEDFGLMFYNARWYDPCIMQFNQPDTIIPEPYNPQSLNRYAYGLNNPIRYTDPTGHRPEDGCNTTGCNRNEKQINDEQKALGKLKKLGDERKCRGGNKNYCVQMDEWAWDNIPSTIVIHKGLTGQAGFGGEFGQYREVAYAYNWRSFEAEKLYVEGRYAYIGTPQLWSIGLYKGVSLIYGASSVSSLEGASSASGFTASLDGGGTINAAYAAGIAVDEDGERLVDDISGRPIQSLQVNAGAGWNGIPNIADAGGILADEIASIGTPTGGWDKFWYYFLSGLP